MKNTAVSILCHAICRVTIRPSEGTRWQHLGEREKEYVTVSFTKCKSFTMLESREGRVRPVDTMCGLGRQRWLSTHVNYLSNSHQRCSNCDVWWLPVWSLQEMQDCRRRLYPHVAEELMETRFLEYGGLIRNVLGNPNVPLKSLGAATLSAEQAFSLYELSRASVESGLRDIFLQIAVSRLV